jgi:hypothetical protein
LRTERENARRLQEDLEHTNTSLNEEREENQNLRNKTEDLQKLVDADCTNCATLSDDLDTCKDRITALSNDAKQHRRDLEMSNDRSSTPRTEPSEGMEKTIAGFVLLLQEQAAEKIRLRLDLIQEREAKDDVWTELDMSKARIESLEAIVSTHDDQMRKSHEQAVTSSTTASQSTRDLAETNARANTLTAIVSRLEAELKQSNDKAATATDVIASLREELMLSKERVSESYANSSRLEQELQQSKERVDKLIDAMTTSQTTIQKSHSNAANLTTELEKLFPPNRAYHLRKPVVSPHGAGDADTALLVRKAYEEPSIDQPYMRTQLPARVTQSSYARPFSTGLTGLSSLKAYEEPSFNQPEQAMPYMRTQIPAHVTQPSHARLFSTGLKGLSSLSSVVPRKRPRVEQPQSIFHESDLDPEPPLKQSTYVKFFEKHIPSASESRSTQLQRSQAERPRQQEIIVLSSDSEDHESSDRESSIPIVPTSSTQNRGQPIRAPRYRDINGPVRQRVEDDLGWRTESKTPLPEKGRQYDNARNLHQGISDGEEPIPFQLPMNRQGYARSSSELSHTSRCGDTEESEAPEPGRLPAYTGANQVKKRVVRPPRSRDVRALKYVLLVPEGNRNTYKLLSKLDPDVAETLVETIVGQCTQSVYRERRYVAFLDVEKEEETLTREKCMMSWILASINHIPKPRSDKQRACNSCIANKARICVWMRKIKIKGVDETVLVILPKASKESGVSWESLKYWL